MLDTREDLGREGDVVLAQLQVELRHSLRVGEAPLVEVEVAHGPEGEGVRVALDREVREVVVKAGENYDPLPLEAALVHRTVENFRRARSRRRHVELGLKSKTGNQFNGVSESNLSEFLLDPCEVRLVRQFCWRFPEELTAISLGFFLFSENRQNFQIPQIATQKSISENLPSETFFEDSFFSLAPIRF